MSDQPSSLNYHITDEYQAKEVLGGLCYSCRGRRQYLVEGEHCDIGQSWMVLCPVCDGTGKPAPHQIVEARLLMDGICPACHYVHDKAPAPRPRPNNECVAALIERVRNLEERIAQLEQQGQEPR